jgi:ketosteroid isomerase-like protein
MPHADIPALEEQRRQAMLAGDARALGALLAPDLYYAHSTGLVDSREAILARIESGAIVYQRLEFTDLATTGVEDAGIVHGLMHATVKSGGVLKVLASRYVAVWLRRGGLWRLADRKSTRLNSSHSTRSRMPSSA